MSDDSGRMDVSDEEVDKRDILQVRATIALGAAAEQLLRSDVGRVLRSKCESDMLAALEDLGEAAPTDAGAIANLQVKYRSAKGVMLYLEEMVHAGIAAESNFREADTAGG